MYYHVIVRMLGRLLFEKFDVNEKYIAERIIRPYEYGHPTAIDGQTFELVLSTIEIWKTEHSAEKYNWQTSGPVRKGFAPSIVENVTDDLLTGPYGSQLDKIESSRQSAEKSVMGKGNKIFIVHGHDHALKDELYIFLTDINLDPIVLHRQADQGQTVIEKLEKYAKEVGFAFILLTPDDIGYRIDEEQKSDGERRKEQRARQNVIFEFGFFIAKLGRCRVCYLYKPNVIIPTDVKGLLYKKVTGSIKDIGSDILKELRAAEYKV